MTATELDVRDLQFEVELGTAARPSLRTRVHKLESDHAAANAARAALDAVYAIRRTTRYQLASLTIAVGAVVIAVVK